jgi:hypothetical protein
MKKLLVRTHRVALVSSVLIVCLASSAGCSSCADDGKENAKEAPPPVQGSGGPGSKRSLMRQRILDQTGVAAVDAAVDDAK